MPSRKMLPTHAHMFSQTLRLSTFAFLCALFFVLIPVQPVYAAQCGAYQSAAAQSAPDPLNPPPLLAPDAAPRPTSGSLGPDFSGCGGSFVPAKNASYEQEVFKQVNQIRAQNNLPPLQWMGSLSDAGRYHAADMAQDGYFNHDSYDLIGGKLQMVCAWSARIKGYYGSYRSLAENIAAGYSKPADVMNGWMNSAGHKANILNPNVQQLGVGYFEGGSYGRYWVEDFGSGGDNVTPAGPLVSLYLPTLLH